MLPARPRLIVALLTCLCVARSTSAQPTLEMDLGIVNGKLAGRVVATEGGQELQGETWSLAAKLDYMLKPPGVNLESGGLYSTWTNGNLTSDQAWSDNLSNPTNFIAAPFLLDKISYGGDTPNSYPAPTGLTGNRDNYSVQWQGEIFIPKGAVTFRDGNDDYAKLVIGGETLIDDNTWTSWNGVDNGGGGVGTFNATKTSETVEGLTGGWYPIIFRGAEGGGGDNFRLVWDATDKGISGADAAAFENPDTSGEFFTVGSPFFRAIDPGLIARVTIPLGIANATGGPAGFAGVDGFGEPGTNAYLPFSGGGQPFNPFDTSTDLILRASIGGLSLSLEKLFEFHHGGGGCTLAGDVNCDTRVDLTDFGILKANFGKSGAMSVPEPATAVLAWLGLALFVAARKRCG
ncbi:MAG: PA14 domain-containing protein [Pirellulales bacterium]